MKKIFAILICCFSLLFAYAASAQGVSQEDLENWRRAAEQGNPAAQFNIALSYYKGAFGAGKESEGARWLRKSAEQGYDKAQGLLGVAYYQGSGVPKDNAEAAKWLEKSAAQGNQEAQSNLNYMYQKGEAVKRSPEMIEKQAQKFDSRSATEGAVVSPATKPKLPPSVEGFYSAINNQAQKILVDAIACSRELDDLPADFSKNGEYQRKDSQCNKTWDKLYDEILGDDDKKFLQCRCSSDGICDSTQTGYKFGTMSNHISRHPDKSLMGKNVSAGVLKTCLSPQTIKIFSFYETAFQRQFRDIERKKIRQAAENNDVEGQYKLANIYYKEKNYSEALKLYRKSADRNHADALGMMGTMHMNGFGVKKDKDKAVSYFKQAAEMGSEVSRARYEIATGQKLSLGTNNSYSGTDRRNQENMEKANASKAMCSANRQSCLSSCTRQQCGNYNYGSSASFYECKMVQDYGCQAGCPVCY